MMFIWTQLVNSCLELKHVQSSTSIKEEMDSKHKLLSQLQVVNMSLSLVRNYRKEAHQRIFRTQQ